MDLEKHISEQKDLLKMMDLSEFSETVQPKEGEQRDMGVREFATLWMGSVHNVLAYMTVAGFFLLGLNSKQVILAVMTSAVIVSFLCNKWYFISKIWRTIYNITPSYIWYKRGSDSIYRESIYSGNCILWNADCYSSSSI